MSALGYFLETAGIATAGISLVREHSVKMRPPRALWVPFELGRPFGAPGDAEFQHRVLAAALALLDAPSGPVLDDFPDDAPTGTAPDAVAWSCPVSFPPPPVDAGDIGAALAAEIGRLAPWHAEAVRQRGRSTVGVGEFDIDAAAQFAASFLTDPPKTDATTARRLKSAIEDLKAYYGEAAAARPDVASTDTANWLWRETALGRLMFRLAETLAAQDDAALRYLAGQSLVPRAQADWWKMNRA